MSYNGWTNYETWCVNLHLTNTQASQEEWDAEARAAWEVARVRDKAVVILGRIMQDTFGVGNCPDVQGFYGDLLRAAVSEVNWFEIAGHFIDGVREEINA